MTAPTRLPGPEDSLVWIADEHAEVRLQTQHVFIQHGLAASIVESIEAIAPQMGRSVNRPAILVIGADEPAIALEAARSARAAGFTGQLLCSCFSTNEASAATARAAGADGLIGRPLPVAVVVSLARSFGRPEHD